jgi:hypothetical protein
MKWDEMMNPPTPRQFFPALQNLREAANPSPTNFNTCGGLMRLQRRQIVRLPTKGAWTGAYGFYHVLQLPYCPHRIDWKHPQTGCHYPTLPYQRSLVVAPSPG